jgi:nucleotide-binding universal stress UspA family protein
LVAIRSTQNLYMLEKTLAETDPFTTDVIVMTGQVAPRGDVSLGGPDLDHYNRELMTAVVNRAEKAGKHVQPLIVRTNNPLFSVVQTAKELHAQELVLGVSNIYNADDQIEQIAFYWISLFGGDTEPLTVRLLSQSRDLYFDLAGGNRIPKIGERQARSVAELRSAGVGVSHVLVAHYGNSMSSDLFTAALTMLDPLVAFSVVRIPLETEEVSETDWFELDLQRAKKLNREVEVYPLPEGDPNEQIVELARRLECGLVVIGQLEESDQPGRQGLDFERVAKNSPCSVCLVAAPSIPQEVAE